MQSPILSRLFVSVYVRIVMYFALDVQMSPRPQSIQIL